MILAMRAAKVRTPEISQSEQVLSLSMLWQNEITSLVWFKTTSKEANTPGPLVSSRSCCKTSRWQKQGESNVTAGFGSMALEIIADGVLGVIGVSKGIGNACGSV